MAYAAQKLAWLGLSRAVPGAQLSSLAEKSQQIPHPCPLAFPGRAHLGRSRSFPTALQCVSCQRADTQGPSGAKTLLSVLLPAHPGAQINAKCYSRLRSACQLASELARPLLSENILSEESQALTR